MPDEIKDNQEDGQDQSGEFGSLAEYLSAIYAAHNGMMPDPRLIPLKRPGELIITTNRGEDQRGG
jgi:hypothetical protein